jgi:hypothetical protein
MARSTYLLPLLGVLLPSVASATGICENTGTTYGKPTMFAEATETFAIPATLAWCDEKEVGFGIEEERGTISYVELRDVSDKVVGVISSATGKNAKRLEEKVGTFTKVGAGKLDAELKKRGFVRLNAKSPAKQACRAQATFQKARKDKVNGFPAERMFLEVRAGTQRMLRNELGLSAAARHDKGVVIAHFYTTKKAVALFTLVPACGGPPPGYFGPDDAGDCYAIDDIKTSVIDASTGDLARCF